LATLASRLTWCAAGQRLRRAVSNDSLNMLDSRCRLPVAKVLPGIHALGAGHFVGMDPFSDAPPDRQSFFRCVPRLSAPFSRFHTNQSHGDASVPVLTASCFPAARFHLCDLSL